MILIALSLFSPIQGLSTTGIPLIGSIGAQPGLADRSFRRGMELEKVCRMEMV